MRIQLDSNQILLKNTTRYDDKQVAWLVKFAAKYVRSEFVRLGFGHEFDNTPIAMRITKCSWSYCGRFLYRASGGFLERKYGMKADLHKWYQNVLVRIGSPKRFPVKTQYPTFKDMPEGDLRDWQEAVVAITAHELCHIHYRGGKEGETNCELIMLDTVTAFRRDRQHFDDMVQKERDAEIERRLATARASNPDVIRERRKADAQAKLAQWQRKAKLAQTKVKKYQRTVNRLAKAEQAPVMALSYGVQVPIVDYSLSSPQLVNP